MFHCGILHMEKAQQYKTDPLFHQSYLKFVSGSYEQKNYVFHNKIWHVSLNLLVLPLWKSYQMGIKLA